MARAAPAGGAPCALTGAPIDTAALRRAVDDPSFGCVLLFEGVARDNSEGRSVRGLEYQAYPEMAEPVLRSVRAEAEERWPGVRVAIVHRTGHLEIGECSLAIAVGAPHRAQAYEASRHCLEAIKSRLPVWKKELYTGGAAGWKTNEG